jgi:TolB-like protein/Flp pilus assembly protein TadD
MDDSGRSEADRIDSWKEIAAYLGRGVSTVQRWERTEGLPVHRLAHARSGSIHAYRNELDAWWRERSARLGAEDLGGDEAGEAVAARSVGRWVRVVPAALVGVGILAGAGYLLLRRPPPDHGRTRLVVLPFRNLSGSAEDDYLADGVTEELTTVLARLDHARLAVIARTSAMTYRPEGKDVAQVGRELGVDYVLEGSVRHAGGRIRITAQLVEVSRQTHLWAESYDRELADVLQVESDIAAAIGGRLAIRLLPLQADRPAPSGEARIAYLKGLYFANQRGEEGLRQAIEMYEQAIATADGYAAAHAGEATAWALLATSAGALDAGEARARADAAARRALELDPGSPEGHAALSIIRCRFDWDWAACERELETALGLDPNYAAGHLWLGEHLIQRGRFGQGVDELQKARALDPVSAIVHTHLGIAHMYARRHDQALFFCEQALHLDPRFLLAHRVKGLTLVRAGRVDEGLAALRQARGLSPRNAHAAADLGYALAAAGRREEARGMLRELQQLAAERPVSAYDFAVVQAGLGEKQTALDSLDKAFTERATGVRWLKVESLFDGLRREPRFQALLRQVGLPD